MVGTTMPGGTKLALIAIELFVERGHRVTIEAIA
jgi:hypothetical protein